MGTLYIIGNGFDLYFNLKTRTEHFAENLKSQFVYNEADNALEVLNSYGVDWYEYEQSLNNIDLEELEYQNEIPPDYLSDRESDRDGGIVNMQMCLASISNAIYSALEQMVADANYDARELSLRSKKRMLFKRGDAILSFNYTSTLEYLFDIPIDVPVFHIHGNYEQGEPLIFGYRSNETSYTDTWFSMDEECWDLYIEQQRELVYRFYESWRKSLQIERLRAFLSGCKEIDRIVVLGHSMSAVDSDYMEQVERCFQPISWDISVHNEDDIARIYLQRYSFQDKIYFFSMEELLKR